ncbi:flagellar assembly peptidoglycan hydrolase FlgJ [Noviherbaspirillum saxi]|uniref:Peptidoglycan hydrolase FlgJ n=1 Tax=Noviherbaspirillum saxi TaxID=2320863 RepID=A0A3A3FVR9_9BURK|nr:flagellar assembly peptidoglycan hydrolase FlgJ [Noviherbaspirillum saxi]RJF98668.1 flagellar assembly peptidoglycan hydrolase FlgJ [Noviherbaspirillum saxi]
MVNRIDTTSSFALDVKDVGKLRQAAKENSPEALKATVKQFEALFMNMVLKSMREATPQESVFDSQQSKMYTSMLDQQLSQTMASRGVGLADVLVRQLSNVVDKQRLAPADEEAALSNPEVDAVLSLLKPASPAAPVALPEAARQVSSNKPMHIRSFQEKLGAAAEEASRSTGIPAKFMLGQAALESGWGKREIKAADGSSSHNVFGIKATSGWKGKVVEAVTTEYINGTPQTRVEKFRAYDSYADAFRDYARMLSSNPRYQNVIASAQDVHGFAQGLQKAGYATDPHYAAKLTRLIKHSLST